MRSTIIFALAASLVGCGGRPSPPPAPGKPVAGRTETQGIRNTDAIGMSGSGVARKVDAALDANDQRKGQLDSVLDAQEKGEPSK